MMISMMTMMMKWWWWNDEHDDDEYDDDEDNHKYFLTGGTYKKSLLFSRAFRANWSAAFQLSPERKYAWVYDNLGYVATVKVIPDVIDTCIKEVWVYHEYIRSRLFSLIFQSSLPNYEQQEQQNSIT